MKVRAVVSFASMVGGELAPWPVGRVAELPEGVNWLKLGWVVEVEAEPVAEEPATLPALAPLVGQVKGAVAQPSKRKAKPAVKDETE